ncbi:MAG: hypothetical protein ACE5JD_07355 [Candidatus Methylomirabilia bacterium]
MRRRIAIVFLLVFATGCATVRHDERMAPRRPSSPTGRSLVVGIGLDRANRPTVRALARGLARELDDLWGSVFEAGAFAEQTAQAGSPIPLDYLERVGAGAALKPEVVEWLKRTHAIQSLIFLDVRLFDQEWGPYTRRTRIKLVAWALDLNQLAVTWRAISAPEVEGESGRSFQLASEAAVKGLVRALKGEAPPRWPTRILKRR